MAQEDGTPNPATFDDLRRKLGGIAKQKAPGYSGNGPDLHAPMPDVWAAGVLLLLNITQHSGVTPHAWHIDLMHYLHTGGEDSSLSNHRPLTLVDVLRKVFSAVSTSRMRRDWTRLRILDPCNPGFEPGEINCGCGHKPEWANRDQVGQLQWHMFACSLPEETNVQRRWLQAVRRDIAAHIKDAAVARIVVRCWTHTSNGRIAAAEQD
jgi:hypothetical protein